MKKKSKNLLQPETLKLGKLINIKRFSIYSASHAVRLTGILQIQIRQGDYRNN